MVLESSALPTGFYSERSAGGLKESENSQSSIEFTLSICFYMRFMNGCTVAVLN